MANRQRNEEQKTDLPEYAKVVIIGGGVIGCSTAYHLPKDFSVLSAEAKT